MKLFLSAFLLSVAAGATELLNENFDGTFPPADWTESSVEHVTTYAHSGINSVRLSAAADYLITPPLATPAEVIFWTYATSSNLTAIIDYAAGTNGPWTAITNISGNAAQWVEGRAAAPVAGTNFFRFRKNGTGNLYIDDVSAVSITVTNPPPVPAELWNVYYNLPQQSSGAAYTDQFIIRNAFIQRINQLTAGQSATLTTFTFSANEGAGTLINAINAALDRGADIRFIADNEAEADLMYGGSFSLRDLTFRETNPLKLTLDDHAGGIMHSKLGLFDFSESNKVVIIASWNFTLAASANQWNIAVEIRNNELYDIYKAETDELFAGRFHDHTTKSHTHDGRTFALEDSHGENFVRFAPYPDSANNAERDIIALINSATNEIVFALNKLNRTPVRDALLAAAARGVKISGVMPRSDTDEGKVSHAVYTSLTNAVAFFPAAARADYSSFDSGESDLIHAKYMVIDNSTVIHGSANWTTEGLTGLNNNDENILFIRHAGIAGEFYKHFQRVTGSGIYSAGNSVLAEWNFADGDRVADAGTPANLTAEMIRSPEPSSYSFISGMLSLNGWNGGANSAYWETEINTIKHTNIKVSSLQTATATGPAAFQLQYKTAAAGDYADVGGGAIKVEASGGYAQLARVSLPAECNNQSNVFLRWLMVSNIAPNGGTVASTGAGRIDNVIISGDAFDQPPVFDYISDKEVFEGTALSFSVSARDLIDGDPVSLSAVGLPTGAVFTNGIFIWNFAAPSGVFDVLFIATDKDAAVTNRVRITVMQRPQLFISEIADPAGTGGDSRRFVELYNAGATVIDLAADRWFLCRQNNGGTSWGTIPLTGAVAPMSTYVVAKSRDDFFAAYGFEPDQESSSVDGNGIDAYFLYRNGSHTNGLLIDAFGERDVNGTGTNWEYSDGRAERRSAVLHPSPVWNEDEWIIVDGSEKIMTPGDHGPRPEFETPMSVFVFAGDSLNMSITAFNPVLFNDVIILSAGELPTGASFTGATGTGRVTGVLSWPLPLYGTHRAVLFAEGLAGTRRAEMIITVGSSARLAGLFYGWRGDTIFKFTNGQFWQQSVAGVKNVSPPLDRPFATITNQFGQRRMFVDGVSGYIEVAQIDVIESSIAGAFAGLHYDNYYMLSDGTFWKQISFENISSAAAPVRVWRWMKNGQQMLRFFDSDDREIGTCIVEPASMSANSAIVSRISGQFNGWRHRELFILENGQCWEQISLTAVATILYAPAVTISNWLDSGIFRMSVAGMSAPVDVREIHLDGSGTIDGAFSGMKYGAVYQLDTGARFVQVSFENIRVNVSSPRALFWNESGQTVLLIRTAQNETVGRCIVLDADADDDGDGMTNANEILSGTNPSDSESVFTLRAAGGFVLTWNAVEGYEYYIEHTSALTVPFKTVADHLVWPQNSWTDTTHTASPQNFYRIKVRSVE